MSTFQGWTATLSNGENAWEQPPVAGEKSSWQKLLDRLDKDNLKITSLRIQRGGVTVHTLPHKQCDGYFQAYDQHTSMYGGAQILIQGCGSIIGDKIFITWIDGNNNVYSEVRSFIENRIHTTLRLK